jgi:uncharacterized damage-inducible protein DinB
MENNTLGKTYLMELEAEAPASRKCLERIPAELFGWKPHEKSMPMGYLALIVAEVPRWISTAIEESEINFGTFKRGEAKTPVELVAYFDENMKKARAVLEKVTDAQLQEMFSLKNKEQLLMSSTKQETVGSSINHMVHHRGQLTVYMRLNNIAVPSIYGPSADDKTWG